jgi:hypothetical protein
MTSLKHTLVVTICLGWATPQFAVAYEEDVHLGLTMWLAMKTGYSTDQAMSIAIANQRLDDDASTAAVSLSWAFVFGSDQKAKRASQTIYDLHFRSDTKPPAPRDKRFVAHGYNPVREEAKRASTSAALGIALHTLQDTWSHQGPPDIPWRPLHEFRPLLGWGHPMNRGEWNRHKADLTPQYPADAFAMAFATYDLLIKSALEKSRDPADWKDIAQDACEYIVANTKSQKREWLGRMWAKLDIPPPSVFIDAIGRINLPIGRLTSPALSGQSAMDRCDPKSKPNTSDGIAQTMVLSKAELVSSSKLDTNAECSGVHSSIDQFLTNWVIKRDVNSAAQQVDLSAIQLQLNAWRPGVRTDASDWVKVILLSWLVEDHGMVESLGHGDPAAEGYFKLPRSGESAEGEMALDDRKYIKLEDALLAEHQKAYMVAAVAPKLCATYFRFKRLHHDAVTILWSLKSDGWKVSSFYWITS